MSIEAILDRVKAAKGPDRDIAHDLCLLWMGRDDYADIRYYVASATALVTLAALHIRESPS